MMKRSVTRLATALLLAIPCQAIAPQESEVVAAQRLRSASAATNNEKEISLFARNLLWEFPPPQELVVALELGQEGRPAETQALLSLWSEINGIEGRPTEAQLELQDELYLLLLYLLEAPTDPPLPPECDPGNCINSLGGLETGIDGAETNLALDPTILCICPQATIDATTLSGNINFGGKNFELLCAEEPCSIEFPNTGPRLDADGSETYARFVGITFVLASLPASGQPNVMRFASGGTLILDSCKIPNEGRIAIQGSSTTVTNARVVNTSFTDASSKSKLSLFNEQPVAFNVEIESCLFSNNGSTGSDPALSIPLSDTTGVITINKTTFDNNFKHIQLSNTNDDVSQVDCSESAKENTFNPARDYPGGGGWNLSPDQLCA